MEKKVRLEDRRREELIAVEDLGEDPEGLSMFHAYCLHSICCSYIHFIYRTCQASFC